jgi:hypothetical protein
MDVNKFVLTDKIKKLIYDILMENVSNKYHISIINVSDGFNVRLRISKTINNKKSQLKQALIVSGKNPYYCLKCGGFYQNECDAHHIIHRSAGGNDNADNGVFLCRKCHAELHDGKWNIKEIIGG